MEYFKVGTEFHSFADVKSRIEQFQRSTYAQFYVKDSRTIQSALKRTQTQKVIKPELKYTFLVYSCIAGGKKFQSKSKGCRPNQRTFKKDCEAEIKLSVGKDGNHLKVVSFNGNHNHECSKLGFSHLPQQRRLNEAATDEAVRLLSMRCNKKVLQHHIQAITGKIVTGRDISNIRAKFLKHGKNKNNIEEVVKKLRENEGSTAAIAVDCKNNLLGIYYQDQSMKESFAAFPEILFVDARYKLKKPRMPLYILMGEDGNGESEIFATFLVASEEKSVFSKMIKIFKEKNPDWPQTKSIMSDKDFTERHVLGKEFPEASQLICLSHMLHSIRNEITTTKMGITSDQRRYCLEIIQKMVYAKSEDEYYGAYKALKMTGFTSVVQYFEDNWHENHLEWVEGLKAENLTFLNRTNNRLESLNKQIREVCQRHASLEDFYHDLLLLLNSTRQDQDHKAINVFQKRSVSLYDTDSPQARYMALLTPYAFSYVVQQLELATKVTNVKQQDDHYVLNYILKSTASRCKVSTSQCECSFRSAMHLPCRHIFAVRKIEGKDSFDKTLCHPRWSIDYYYKSKHAVNQNLYVQDIDASTGNQQSKVVVVDNLSQSVILSQGQKYSKVSKLCKDLSSVVSEAPMPQFEHQYHVLEQIYDAWRNGIRVGVHFDNDESRDKNNEASSTTSTQVGPTGLAIKKERNNAESPKVLIPRLIRKREHPKSADLTVIGSPSKRSKVCSLSRAKPVPIFKK